MSDMKCPICQNNLHKINIIVSTCTNDKCKLWGSSIPNLVLDALAQAKQDLERTFKALDVAKNAINSAVDHNIINCMARSIDPRTDDTNVTLCNALEKITALEQKDK